MALLAFGKNEILAVRDAVDIAEDLTGNYFKASLGQWLKYGYEIKTLVSLARHEITEDAFALLQKASLDREPLSRRDRVRDCYIICLQDHQILKALERDTSLVLQPLLVYVLTHELVHIVRFRTFLQRFEVGEAEREKEEELVHEICFDILRGFSNPEIGYVLKSYEGHRLGLPFKDHIMEAQRR